MKNSWINELRIQNGEDVCVQGTQAKAKNSVMSGVAPNPGGAFPGRDFTNGTKISNSLDCENSLGKIHWQSSEKWDGASASEKRKEQNIECATCPCIKPGALHYLLVETKLNEKTNKEERALPGTAYYNIFVQLKEKATEDCYIKINIETENQSGEMLVKVETGSDESVGGVVALPAGRVKLSAKA